MSNMAILTDFPVADSVGLSDKWLKSGRPGSHREGMTLQNKLFPKKSHWEMVSELCESECTGKNKIPRTSQGSELSYVSPPVLDQNNFVYRHRRDYCRNMRYYFSFMIYGHNTFISCSDTHRSSQLCIGLYSCSMGCMPCYSSCKPFSHHTTLLLQMETVREIKISMEFSVVPQLLLGLQHSINWCLINFGVWGTHQLPCASRMHIHPLKKEINFPWRQTTCFSASFQKAYTFEQDLKSSAVSKRPENLYGKNRHTSLHNLSIFESDFWDRKKAKYKFVHLFWNTCLNAKP